MSKVDQPRTFDEVSAVIRLADKYHIESVQDHALRVLQRYHFTSDFAAFSGPPDTEISVEPIHAIGAVNLAHLTDTPRMLPLALYKCCYLDDETLLAGWTRADGTVEHLTPADLARCSTARVSLLVLRASLDAHIHKELRSSRACTSTLGLQCAWTLGLRLVGAVMARVVGCDVFSGWAKLSEEISMGQSDLCGTCIREIVRNIWVARRRIWDALPETFGVVAEGWKSPEASGSQDAAGAP